MSKGWAGRSALFKAEGDQVNIGLGGGPALDIFNDGMTGIQGDREMTPDQREAILGLVIAPGRPPKVTPDEVLGRFGTSDGTGLGLSLLRDAVERKDGTDVELALIVCFTFGLTAEHLHALMELCRTDWHQSHEDAVLALDRLRSPDAVDALVRATEWVPDYLDYDESRALAAKAIWALGKTPGTQADLALERLTASKDTILREAAEAQLKRRR
ncbi:HEAT repeat domain-containing protein [Nonomuraea sp. KM90]|uniref:HEAT repeat domain-containing protein n=1 Tax=Nonomuraea sp. KM90 TaxID=3457428 RepID=UPI003FCD16D1